MSTFVIVHGGWSGGYNWQTVRRLLQDAGHEVFTPTLTGVGERSHLAHAGIGLSTHVEDIVNVIEYEDLHNVILAGHSYGGMVITGVADRVTPRLAHLVYLDAFVPSDGQSLADLENPAIRARLEAQAQNQADGWRVPPNALSADMSAEDAVWATRRRGPQPVNTFLERVRTTGAARDLPRTYVHCAKNPNDVFAQFAERARQSAGWTLHVLDTGHHLQYTMPRETADILLGVRSR